MVQISSLKFSAIWENIITIVAVALCENWLAIKYLANFVEIMYLGSIDNFHPCMTAKAKKLCVFLYKYKGLSYRDDQKSI